MFHKVFGIGKIYGSEGGGGGRMDGVSRHSFNFFLSHSTKKLRRGTFVCSIKCLVSEKFWIRVGERKREGVSRFCIKIFFVL